MRQSTRLMVVPRPVEGDILLGDVSTGVFRPLLPRAFRDEAIWSLHRGAHPGIRSTVKLVSASFVWPKMAAYTRRLVRTCLDCQRGKVYRHVHLRAEHIPVPTRRFAHLHVDLVGPLPLSAGFNYVFTILDRTTRWPEAVPLKSIAAADCAHALLHGWVQRFGVPATITSDRGAQFTSSLWASLCAILDIVHVPTTAYHPESNGLVERFHRRLKDSLRARAASADWFAHLPWVMLGLRTQWRADADFTPAEAVFGSQPVLPGQYLGGDESTSPSFLADFQGVLAARRPLPTAHHVPPGPPTLPEELLLSRFVLVRHDGVQPPLSPLYDGPYLVLERSLHFFKIQLGTRTDTVSTHRLKACHAPFGAEAALPPARGRPRATRADPASGGLKKMSGVPTVHVPWADGREPRPWAAVSGDHLIPPEARGIGSSDTGVPASRVSPACVATNPVEGRAHATLPVSTGPSAASGRESTPALRGVLPQVGDPSPGSSLRARASCLRNGPSSPASVRGWAANKPAWQGAAVRRVVLSLIPLIIPDVPAPTSADAGGGRPRRITRPPARYSD
jgi:hypothetical protein